MTHADAVERVRRAREELDTAERDLERSARSWRGALRPRRGAVAIFGGFVSGAALVLLPARWWRRAGAAAGGLAAAAARSALTPMIVGAALSQVRAESRGDAAANDAHTRSGTRSLGGRNLG